MTASVSTTGPIEDFSRVIAIDPVDVKVRYGRGVARLRVGANEEAIEDFSAILEIVPDATRALLARAVARQWVGRDDAANEDFDRYFEFATDEADADPAGDARAGTPTRLGKNASLVGPTSSRCWMTTT